MNNKTFIIVVCVLAIASILGIVSYLPAKLDSGKLVKMANFPKQIGEWQSRDIELSKQDYEILETNNLIMREYKNTKGEAVLLYIVYSEDNRKVSHPPEVCYMGSGATVVEKEKLKLSNSINANKMLAESPNNQQIVIYWYKAGSLNTNNYLKQQLKIALARTFGKCTSGALIRLSADIKEDNETAALNLLKSFTSQIEPLLHKYVP